MTGKPVQSEGDFLGLKLVFPWPDSRLNPNSSKRHWKSKMGPTKRAREEARIVAWATKQEWLHAQPDVSCATVILNSSTRHGFPWQQATAHITWYPPTGRRRDYGNLLSALKPTFDGIVDAGILADDSSKNLAIGRLELAKPDRVKPRVEIVIVRLVK